MLLKFELLFLLLKISVNAHESILLLSGKTCAADDCLREAEDSVKGKRVELSYHYKYLELPL